MSKQVVKPGRLEPIPSTVGIIRIWISQHHQTRTRRKALMKLKRMMAKLRTSKVTLTMRPSMRIGTNPTLDSSQRSRLSPLGHACSAVELTTTVHVSWINLDGENFFLTYPKDYDIRNDPVFDCKRSTYNRLMDIQHPVPEPTTSEMLRTGHCGPDPHSLSRGVFLRDRRELDLRPEPAYRMHLADRTSVHYMRSDPLEGVLPFGRVGDMTRAKSVSHRDFKWRVCCPVKPPCQPTMDRKVHRRARTDIHGRDFYNKVVKFDDDDTEAFFDQNMMKLKKAYWWPTNPITNETLGGHLLYHQDDPCMENRHEIWPCGEKDVLECNPICIPEDRCQVLAHEPKHKQKQRELNFYNKSYLDMRYPYRNYECFEEVPDCCVKPEQFPSECCFTKGEIDMPCPKTGNTCPPKGPCPKVC